MFIAFIVLLNNTVAGAFLLGFEILIFGVIAAFNIGKFESNTVEASDTPDLSEKKTDTGDTETEE